jgi:HNH endonuclease
MQGVGVVKTTKQKKPRDEMPYSVRFDVLSREQFTCRACGARPGNAGLEVDHLVPWSLGGSHHPENLTVLCVRCNRGKLARLWIPPVLLADPNPDKEGFVTWRQFESWTVQVNGNCLCAAWTPNAEYTWFEAEHCWNTWESHFAMKNIHVACDCATPMADRPPSENLYQSDYKPAGTGCSFTGLRATIAFLRTVLRREASA